MGGFGGAAPLGVGTLDCHVHGLSCLGWTVSPRASNEQGRMGVRRDIAGRRTECRCVAGRGKAGRRRGVGGGQAGRRRGVGGGQARRGVVGGGVARRGGVWGGEAGVGGDGRKAGTSLRGRDAAALNNSRSLEL